MIISALPFASCVTLGKLLNLSVPRSKGNSNSPASQADGSLEDSALLAHGKLTLGLPLALNPWAPPLLSHLGETWSTF